MNHRVCIPLDIATQSLILSAFSISFPVAFISSNLRSEALFILTPGVSASSESSSPDSSRRGRPDRLGGASLSLSLSSSESESLESEPAVRKNRDMAGLAEEDGTGFEGTSSSPLDMSSSSDSEDSESESPACLKNRDIVAVGGEKNFTAISPVSDDYIIYVRILFCTSNFKLPVSYPSVMFLIFAQMCVLFKRGRVS